jgi:exodeoxyribonuclease VII small subunit
MTKSSKPQHTQTFESAVAELESIVSSMESGQLSLEESLASYKRGAELLKFCQVTLQEVQQQVKLLENGTLKTFGPTEQ